MVDFCLKSTVFQVQIKKNRRYFVISNKLPIFAVQLRKTDRGVEQLVARWAHNPKVVSSSLTSATSGWRYIAGFFYTLFYTTHSCLYRPHPLGYRKPNT